MENNIDIKKLLGKRIKELRQRKNLTQEQLAEKACLSRSLISLIEAPGVTKNFTLDAFYSIADALAVDPAALINAAVFPDTLLQQKK